MSPGPEGLIFSCGRSLKTRKNGLKMTQFFFNMRKWPPLEPRTHLEVQMIKNTLSTSIVTSAESMYWVNWSNVRGRADIPPNIKELEFMKKLDSRWGRTRSLGNRQQAILGTEEQKTTGFFSNAMILNWSRGKGLRKDSARTSSMGDLRGGLV